MIIHWFRQDLRLHDNPSLAFAVKSGDVLPVYIFDDVNPKANQIGAASKAWLHHSLLSLNYDLDGALNIYRGDPLEILPKLVKQFEVTTVSWNRCYEPWQIARDKQIKKWLTESNLDAHSHNGTLLWEPWQISKGDGSPYRVFTPFYKNGCLQASAPRKPLPKTRLQGVVDQQALSVDDLNLLPKIPWDKKILSHWRVGEKAARAALKTFIQEGLDDYKVGRDFPAKSVTSRLSPHLHFGEISPHEVWYAVRDVSDDHNAQCFLSELGWREFSAYLLYHFPQMPEKNWQDKFDDFPWRKDSAILRAWQQGRTGIPLVDAGMRELWETGYMHNRVRMVVASFLVKNCLIHWKHGERWFWDCLVDADLANNVAGWQWVAGCGADAAPFFRIFNPSTQGEKFDAMGDYTRHYVPELSDIPEKYLFKPWEAPTEILHESGVILGKTYPEPIIDLKQSREEALSAYKKA